jgi:uncharacterized protein involved in outer membrane biogenesis
MRKLLPVLAILIVLVAIAGALFVRGRIGGDLVRQALERELTTRVGQPVRIGALSASFLPRVALTLRQVTIGGSDATIGRIDVGSGLRGLIARRVEDAELIVSDGRIPVQLALGLAAAAASPGPSSDSGTGFTIQSVRTLAFRHVEIVAGERSVLVDLESSLAGDRLEVTRLTASSDGTRLEAHGALESIARRTGRFTATAGTLDLDEILALAAALSAAAPDAGPRPAGGSAGSPLDLELALSAPGGTLAGYRFESLSTTARGDAQHVRLDPLTFSMFGGTLAGTLRVDTTAAPAAIGLDGTVTGMDVAAILRETSGSRSMTGTLGGRVTLGARGLSTNAMLRSASGRGQVTIADGTIPGLDMVRAVVLAFGKPSGAPPEGSGSAFTRLGATLVLADQTLRSDDVAFASRDFDMTGTATVRLPGGDLNMRAQVVLSRELTAQAGTDLRRYAQADGRVVVPAVITGTVAAPRVTLDVAAALNRALQNEIKRQVGDWLDKVIRQ